jgi:hypothetical protein
MYECSFQSEIYIAELVNIEQEIKTVREWKYKTKGEQE